MLILSKRVVFYYHNISIEWQEYCRNIIFTGKYMYICLSAGFVSENEMNKILLKQISCFHVWRHKTHFTTPSLAVCSAIVFNKIGTHLDVLNEIIALILTSTEKSLAEIIKSYPSMSFCKIYRCINKFLHYGSRFHILPLYLWRVAVLLCSNKPVAHIFLQKIIRRNFRSMPIPAA